MKNILQGDRIILGTCYYPEHWEKNMWRDDLRRMLESGIEVVRIAEFAWSKIELHEGDFNFDFFDEFMSLAKDVGIKVIFCTPTATPPIWLTEKYPEVLNADKNGVLYRHGSRRHYNYNSAKYRELSARIVEQVARHYGSHPNIIGWQIDNEFNCELCEFYSESDSMAFREFLKKKYETLNKLNDAWGTMFWNQIYTSWEEIYVPRPTAFGNTNPLQLLDYKRFISDSTCGYAKLQSDILRKYIKPGDFITTNGLFGNLDSCRMTEESLDFFTYDSYPNFGYCLDTYKENIKELNDRKWSRNLTETRAVSEKFGIMEQQSGTTGNHTGMEGPTPRPGQILLWTMQSIAHGADYISYFRWRTSTIGTEIYWHGILDYSGRDNRRLKEIKDIHKKLSGMNEVAGSRYRASVGILKEYDNVWDSELDVWHGRIEKESQASWFKALQISHIPFDYCYMDHMSVDDMLKYRLLIYTHAVILREETVHRLEEYVRRGGVLLMGCRAGYKDEHGRCVMMKLPGYVSKLCATDIPEYGYVAPDDGEVYADWDGIKLHAAIFNDQLAVLEGGKVEAVYRDTYYDGVPALISNEYGQGKAYYFGGAFSEKTALAFIEKFGISEPYGYIVRIPEECEIAVREKGGNKYLFVLNYSREDVNISLQKNCINMYTGESEEGTIVMKGYETKVYKYCE